MGRLTWTYLGRVPYHLGLRLQEEWAARVAQGADPILLLCEHPPTVTLGRQADPDHLKLDPSGYRARGIEVVRVLRGGDVTYHGPGQLVGYPIASLDAARCSVPAWVRGNAEAIVGTLARHEILARWSDLHPGVWVGPDKIAALGFAISRRISTHGFAINLHADLSPFETIVPCGLRGFGVTSVERLTGRAVPLVRFAAALAARVAVRFGWTLGDSLSSAEVIGALSDATPIAQRG